MAREETALTGINAPYDTDMAYEKDAIEGFFCPSRILMGGETTNKKSAGKRKKNAPDTETGFFDWLAPYYDRLQPVIDPCRNQAHSIMLDVLNAIDPPPESVLNIGCRTGLLTSQILELCPDAHVYAIDNSLAMLQTARDNLRDFTDRITLAMADYRDPWEDIIEHQIDVIVHYGVLHHLPHDILREVYTRLATVLRPGGWFIHADFTAERFPEPVRGIAGSIRDFQTQCAMMDIPDCETILNELEEVRQADEERGRLAIGEAMPEQQVAWLMEAGFDFAVRIYQDWRTSLFLAGKTV